MNRGVRAPGAMSLLGLVLAGCGTLDAAAGTSETAGLGSDATSAPTLDDAGSTAAAGDTTGESASSGNGGTEASGSDDTGTTGGDPGVPGAWCTAIPDCAAPLPHPGPAIDWAQSESSFVVASGGQAVHAGV